MQTTLQSHKDMYLHHLLLHHLPRHCEQQLIIPYLSYFQAFKANKHLIIMPNQTHSHYRELVNIMTLTDSISKELQDDIASLLTYLYLVYQNKLNICGGGERNLRKVAIFCHEIKNFLDKRNIYPVIFMS